jgi:hypothetical protein
VIRTAHRVKLIVASRWMMTATGPTARAAYGCPQIGQTPDSITGN